MTTIYMLSGCVQIRLEKTDDLRNILEVNEPSFLGLQNFIIVIMNIINKKRFSCICLYKLETNESSTLRSLKTVCEMPRGDSERRG